MDQTGRGCMQCKQTCSTSSKMCMLSPLCTVQHNIHGWWAKPNPKKHTQLNRANMNLTEHVKMSLNIGVNTNRL